MSLIIIVYSIIYDTFINHSLIVNLSKNSRKIFRTTYPSITYKFEGRKNHKFVSYSDCLDIADCINRRVGHLDRVMREMEQLDLKSRRLKQKISLVSAFVSNNRIEKDEITKLITTIYLHLSELDKEVEPVASQPVPVVSIDKSITPDFLICLEDGKRLKMLKRHLAAAYGMTPEEYRARWNLPPDYPMVAPNYARRRSDLARSTGLGRKSAKLK